MPRLLLPPWAGLEGGCTSSPTCVGRAPRLVGRAGGLEEVFLRRPLGLEVRLVGLKTAPPPSPLQSKVGLSI